ncbi:MAG: protein kinase domain-containing protein [Betaproteobacteria bacterium]
MPGSVRLVVTAGPIRGQRYEFASHDTFLFGRAADCHARLAANDVSASRHHFLLEANPPCARVRDLGSLNGTHVNGVRHGGRAAGGAAAEVDLRDGDEIRVGATLIRVEIEAPPSAVLEPALHTALRRASDQAPAGEASPGDSIGPYALLRLIGRGGMGAVYLAQHEGGGAPVALKLLLPDALADEGLRELFLREAEVLRALRHPNIVGVLDAGAHEGRLYLALEYCARGSAEGLRQQRGGRLPLPSVLRLTADVLEGLAYAHERGFVHRDIKPDNVLLAEDGTARLGDFGLAKSFEQAGLSGMTATGAVAGTFYFMPREQLTSFRQARPVSDVWSAAATVYYLLTGEYARDFSGHQDPLAVVLRDAAVPLRVRDPEVPADLAELLDRALVDDTERRYADAGAFARALWAVL